MAYMAMYARMSDGKTKKLEIISQEPIYGL